MGSRLMARGGAARDGRFARLGVLALAVGMAASLSAPAAASGPNVLLVGPAGTEDARYTSIQAAVDAANPGDWILVAPGIYHEKGGNSADSRAAGVLITKPDIHLRGMDRGTVILDGTNLAGSADGSGSLPATAANLAAACPGTASAQDPGPKDGSGTHVGRNGIEVYKASGDSVDNLTVCNYLQDNGAHTGNEVWWNAGDGSGTATPMTVRGAYLTATSTFYQDGSSPQAYYGIFTSNIAPDPTYGQSLIDYTYANNQADSAYYIGACPDCNIVLRHAHAQNSALGYSGTNGSGRVIIEQGEWDHLHSGIVPNTLNNDDAPSPQTGLCPTGVTSPDPAAPADSCFVVRDNFVHDNNNPDTPGAGIAGVAPVGAGIELSGTVHDSVLRNNVVGNGSWGIVFHDFPDTETFPSQLPAGDDCAGGSGTSGGCLYPSGKNVAVGNTLSGNGTNGNLTNGDLLNEETPADLASPGANCFSGNTDGGAAATEYPPGLQTAPCPPGLGESALAVAQLLCSSGIVSSTTGLPVDCTNIPKFGYPSHDLTKCAQFAPGSVATGDPTNGACILPLSVTLQRAALQPKLDPCAGAPQNDFCAESSEVVPPATGSPLPNTTAARLAVMGWPVLPLAVGLVIAGMVARRRRAGSAPRG
ncbi:MAG TPA: hypothetical protein VG245_07720 [Candidatus Dormibacteraeota bacterium]|nr:hypothetical protein [Candidatus Dormibacteraeota bacterium]